MAAGSACAYVGGLQNWPCRPQTAETTSVMALDAADCQAASFRMSAFRMESMLSCFFLRSPCRFSRPRPQGKIHDAQKTLRHNGLLRANMKDTLPTSFLRFINNRVAKFIDNAEEEEE